MYAHVCSSDNIAQVYFSSKRWHWKLEGKKKPEELSTLYKHTFVNAELILREGCTKK